MSLRRKYLLVVYAAVAGATGLFLVRNELTLSLIWAVAIVTVLMLAHVFAQRLFVSRPLCLIREGAERLAEGEHTIIQVPGGGEMEDIAAALNRMAGRVAKAKLDLERQVAERTEDLRAVLEEVHERSRIAEEVNRRLEESDHRKTEFLTNVSHELRTPLNAIVGFVRLLRDKLYEGEDERAEFLENTQHCADHLLHLVTDVLSAAQLEAGVLKLNRRALHPADAIHESLRFLNVLFREKGLEVHFEVEGDLMVLADEFKLRQILLNLLSNAVKFTDSGKITVRAKSEDDSVRFEVQDTGEGIPQKDIERVFEKFHQVDSRTARHTGGTGLGLSICRELVHLMGGSIGAESDGPGRGSLFYFTLPAVPHAVEA